MNAPVETEKTQASVRYDAALHRKLKEIADLEGKKLHRCLEDAVREYIERHVD